MSLLEKKVIDCFPMHKQPDTGRFGVEIEMEGEGLPERIQGWALKEEHSLRGESREFATDRAVSMAELRERLFAVRKALDKSKVDTSYRGSTHIHYNVQNETFRTVLNEWVIFTAIEPIFLNIVGGNRNGNLFCLPSYDTGDTVQAFYNQLKAIAAGRSKWDERGKYAAHNTDPIRRFGSVEYRFFPPETGERITVWCQYLDRLWELARGYKTTSSLHDDVLKYLTNPEVFTCVFPAEALPPRYFLGQVAEVGGHLAYELSRKYLLVTKEGKGKLAETEDQEVPDQDFLNQFQGVHNEIEVEHINWEQPQAAQAAPVGWAEMVLQRAPRPRLRRNP